MNPLNGEGIDYGLEGGRLVAEILDADDLTELWPAILRERYGRAFSVARRLAGLLTVPRVLPASGPVAMRSRALMTIAVRVMGNLVTEEDSDLTARAWRASGLLSHEGRLATAVRLSVQRVARCRATTPPVRLRHCTFRQPAASMRSASSSWVGQARIDSARYT